MSVEVSDTILTNLLSLWVADDELGDLHDSELLLQRLLACFVVVFYCKPWVVGEVHVEMVLITIFAYKNDLELFFISVDFTVLSSQSILESTAAWSPVSTQYYLFVQNKFKLKDTLICCFQPTP